MAAIAFLVGKVYKDRTGNRSLDMCVPSRKYMCIVRLLSFDIKLLQMVLVSLPCVTVLTYFYFEVIKKEPSRGKKQLF